MVEEGGRERGRGVIKLLCHSQFMSKSTHTHTHTHTQTAHTQHVESWPRFQIEKFVTSFVVQIVPVLGDNCQRGGGCYFNIDQAIGWRGGPAPMGNLSGSPGWRARILNRPYSWPLRPVFDSQQLSVSVSMSVLSLSLADFY